MSLSIGFVAYRERIKSRYPRQRITPEVIWYMSERWPSFNREREKAASMVSSRNLPDSTSRMMRIEMALRRCPKLSPIGHILQPLDSLFDRRMGAEQGPNAACTERVHYEQGCR